MDLVPIIALAFAAGVLSFTSPCCLPLMPGYVSYISASTDADAPAASRSRALWTSLLFVAGFGVVFTALGAGASTLSGALLSNRQLLSRVGGVVVIVMGLLLAGVVRVPLLQREYRFDLSRVRPGPAGAMPLGMAFAIGWVPCVGPVLAGILTLAASTTSGMRGAALLAVYSLGLAVPFIGLAVAASRLRPVVRWLQRHARGVELAGGAVMIAMGFLLLTDQWIQFFAPLTRLFVNSGWPPL
ncbi:MAG: cytochrome c biogenesis protein CcdA [Actinomycetota bacterium]|nr:cytochrome c biogenesis protein CcdA [Actinomycetota bacterium]